MKCCFTSSARSFPKGLYRIKRLDSQDSTFSDTEQQVSACQQVTAWDVPEDGLLSTKLQSHETFIGDPQNWKDSQSISYLQSLSVPVTWKSDSGIIILRIRKKKPKDKVFVTSQFQILIWSIDRNKNKLIIKLLIIPVID